MARYTLKALAVLVLAMTLSVVSTHAQQSDRMTMTIPFAFSVGDTMLPAGTYRVWRTSASTGTYLISNVDGEGTAVVTSPARLRQRGATRAKLVFDAYYGEYFLAQIWMPTSEIGTELATSQHEERLARAGASPRHVALVAGRR
jgi:hypothetical protein